MIFAGDPKFLHYHSITFCMPFPKGFIMIVKPEWPPKFYLKLWFDIFSPLVWGSHKESTFSIYLTSPTCPVSFNNLGYKKINHHWASAKLKLSQTANRDKK